MRSRAAAVRQVKTINRLQDYPDRKGSFAHAHQHAAHGSRREGRGFSRRAFVQELSSRLAKGRTGDEGKGLALSLQPHGAGRNGSCFGGTGGLTGVGGSPTRDFGVRRFFEARRTTAQQAARLMYIEYLDRGVLRVLKLELPDVKLLQAMLVGLNVLLNSSPPTSLSAAALQWVRLAFNVADRDMSAMIKGEQLPRLLEAVNISMRREVLEAKLQLLKLPNVLTSTQTFLTFTQAASLVEDLRLEPQFIGGLFRKYASATAAPDPSVAAHAPVSTSGAAVTFSASPKSQSTASAHNRGVSKADVLTLDAWLEFQKTEQLCTDEVVARTEFTSALKAARAAPGCSSSGGGASGAPAAAEAPVGATGDAAAAGTGVEGLTMAEFQEYILSDANSALDSAKLAYDETQMEHP